MSVGDKQNTNGWLGSEQRRMLIQEYGIFLAFLILATVLSVSNEFFLTAGNISNVLLQTSINGVLAIGMTFVILTRGIDLSVGSVVALAGLISASFVTTSATAGIAGAPYPVVFGLGIGLLVGVACGAVSGVIVSRFSVPAFVAT
ncbi:ABC transporter permease, partial [Mesorhizobium sp. M7A.T.Ca.US.000.02.1.1]